MQPNREPQQESHEKAALQPEGDRDTAYPGGVGQATGGRYDEKRDPPFPESDPPYAGDHTNMDFDAGEPVHVDAWTADNTASVRYRGTVWTAVPAGGTPQGTGPHRVSRVDGSRLVVEKI